MSETRLLNPLILLLCLFLSGCAEPLDDEKVYTGPGFKWDFGDWWVRENGTVHAPDAAGRLTEARVLEVLLPSELLDQNQSYDPATDSEHQARRIVLYVTPDLSEVRSAALPCMPIRMENALLECSAELVALVWFEAGTPWLFGASRTVAADRAAAERRDLAEKAPFFMDLTEPSAAGAFPPKVLHVTFGGSRHEWRMRDSQEPARTTKQCIPRLPTELGELPIARSQTQDGPPEDDASVLPFSLGEARQAATDEGVLGKGDIVREAAMQYASSWTLQGDELVVSHLWRLSVTSDGTESRLIEIVRRTAAGQVLEYNVSQRPDEDPNHPSIPLPRQLVSVDNGWQRAQRWFDAEPFGVWFTDVHGQGDPDRLRLWYVRPLHDLDSSQPGFGTTVARVFAVDAATGELMQIVERPERLHGMTCP